MKAKLKKISVEISWPIMLSWFLLVNVAGAVITLAYLSLFK